MISRIARWWKGRRRNADSTPAHDGDDHLLRAADSLRRLIEDRSIPREVREALAADYAQVEAMLDKLERGDLHVSVFGRVSVGKSALLNALLGHDAFEVGVLHGTTRVSGIARVEEHTAGGVHLIDTPGIDEFEGEAREALAYEVAQRSDLLLFVVDGDLTQTELAALDSLLAAQRPLLLVLNKADRYTAAECEALLARLAEHARGRVPRENIVAAAALPTPRIVVQINAEGHEHEQRETRGPDIERLRTRMFEVLAAEGKTLAALNAALFAGDLADRVGERIAQARAEVAARVIRSYCLGKGVAVALNPVPLADLVAAAGLDVALVMHLSRVYNLPLTRSEAGRLVGSIAGAVAGLMAVVYGTHLLSAALKTVTVGLSTAVTAGVQGAAAWYATIVVGRAAERYFRAGKSWGEGGPKQVLKEIVESLDRESILAEARAEILARLRRA
ncbi:MAG TPA: GTP-binding protein [Xanthomonadaceae bacterium]|nr:GTP-binding protein [Xanthomonadaceae bacterium]